jgi:hypothetical protein
MSGERLADDLLLGAKSIADWIGCNPRQVYYWARMKPPRFGLFHVGDKIAGRKSRILKELAQLEAVAPAAKASVPPVSDPVTEIAPIAEGASTRSRNKAKSSVKPEPARSRGRLRRAVASADLR